MSQFKVGVLFQKRSLSGAAENSLTPWGGGDLLNLQAVSWESMVVFVEGLWFLLHLSTGKYASWKDTYAVLFCFSAAGCGL